uniref:Uncharacterized protein n=1 Tax=Anguilla anguilla TaxID=7936 RepID=A0A0E9UE74_ANGAN
MCKNHPQFSAFNRATSTACVFCSFRFNKGKLAANYCSRNRRKLFQFRNYLIRTVEGNTGLYFMNLSFPLKKAPFAGD